MRICLFILAVAGMAAPLAQAAPAGPATRDSAKPWDVLREPAFAIAVPRGWAPAKDPQPPISHYFVGDGIGIPAEDENRQPLQARLMVERFPRIRGTLDDAAKAYTEKLKADPRMELAGQVGVEWPTLADGSKACLLTAEFLRKDKSVACLYLKLLARDKQGTGWVITGLLFSGKGSRITTRDSDLARWLRAHVLTFCPDPSTFSDTALAPLYAKPSLAPGGR